MIVLHNFENAATAFMKTALSCGRTKKNLGFTPIRIVTMADPLRSFLLELFRNFEILLEEECDPEGQRQWATTILDFCSYGNLLFACCLSEWLCTSQTWVHKYDNRPGVSVLCRVKAINAWYLGELRLMFLGKNPLVMQKRFQHSTVHHLITGLQRVGSLSLTEAVFKYPARVDGLDCTFRRDDKSC